MAQFQETTLVDVRISVTVETKTTTPDPTKPDETIDLDFTILAFADRHAGDVRVVRIPLDPAAQVAIIEQLTANLDDTARRTLIEKLTGVVVPTPHDIIVPR